MKKKLIYLFLFGIAFAYVEATVVYYLRQVVGYKSGYGQIPIKMILNLGAIAFIEPSAVLLRNQALGAAEAFREGATIIMLFSVAWLAAGKLKQRVGAFLIAFSLWDLFYYVFLHILTGWPTSIFDIDVYFLIPVPWVGPVITPVIISLILLIFGMRLYLKNES